MKGEISVQGRVTPELQLLLCCARGLMRGDEERQFRQLLVASLDWDRLLILARGHGLLPLLYWHLEKLSPAEVPAERLAPLKRWFLRNTGRNLQWTHELSEIIRLLAEHGIPAVPYKGPALAVRLYGNVALREWCDLDLLIRPSDHQVARGLLIQRGYCPRHVVPSAAERFVLERRYSEIFDSYEGFAVEVHWAFTSRAISSDGDTVQAFTRLAPLRVVGAEMKVLADSDLVLALAAHGAKHRWLRLEWLAGLAELVRSMNGTTDWDTVIDHARATRQERVLLVAVRLADEMLRSPVPTKLLERARSDRVVGGLVTDVWRLLVNDEVFSAHVRPAERLAVEWFHFRMVEGVRERVRFVVRRATTPRRSQDARLVSIAGRTIPLEAVVRPVRLLRKLAPTSWASQESRQQGNGKASSGSTKSSEVT